MVPEGMSLQIPPVGLPDTQANRWNTGKAPHLPCVFRYCRAANMRNGYLAAALDNAPGPFSCPISPPGMTSSLNTQYLRPATPETCFITRMA